MFGKLNLKFGFIVLGLLLTEVIFLYLNYYPTQPKNNAPLTYRQKGENDYDAWIARLKKEDSLKGLELKSVKFYSNIEKRLMDSGLVDIKQLDPSINVSLKYSTTDNFTKTDLYGSLNNAYLQKEVADMLLKAQRELKRLYPYYNILVFDAVRPLRIQIQMWDSLKIPMQQKVNFLSNPHNGGSIHNYGAAVDVSIVDESGIELDMGTTYDYFGELGYTNNEENLNKEGKLTRRQIENRKLLRHVMSTGGFTGIESEWWHFNAFSREQAKSKYSVIY